MRFSGVVFEKGLRWFFIGGFIWACGRVGDGAFELNFSRTEVIMLLRIRGREFESERVGLVRVGESFFC